MTTQPEALKLALEALVRADRISGYPNNKEAIAAIRECLAKPEHSCVACEGTPKGKNNPCVVCGLAQPEQEPVAWTTGWHSGHCVIRAANPAIILPIGVALYTTPPHRKPLTDEEIDKLPWEPHEGNPMTFAEGLRYFARAIEAAHGIKE